jgi:hypothetical protein
VVVLVLLVVLVLVALLALVGGTANEEVPRK